MHTDCFRHIKHIATKWLAWLTIFCVFLSYAENCFLGDLKIQIAGNYDINCAF